MKNNRIPERVYKWEDLGGHLMGLRFHRKKRIVSKKYIEGMPKEYKRERV